MKPQIIRADTIDLQSQSSPSAKDHTRQPTHPNALGDGPPAPHQAIALKNAGHEGFEHHTRSPRASQDLSGKELQLLHEPSDQSEDDGGEEGVEEFHGLQDADASDQDGDMVDTDGDDSMDEDMMDKISSSPSIDDGGYSSSLPWPAREDSLIFTPSQKHKQYSSGPQDFASSSPFLSTPVHLPLLFTQETVETKLSEDHHHKGGYSEDRIDEPLMDDSFEDESRDRLTPLMSEQTTGYFRDTFEGLPESYDADFDDSALHHLLLPEDDPLLDNSFDDAPLSFHSSESSSRSSSPSWDGRSDEIDDDTEDISLLDESRFIDSGWGGECLRETEDIDFEFVYALHTFVATVEGQANATKGDTMVLLDDSNSYWWLVRIVKDASIGYLPAEHIETPTERLARLNKHRNIDLSQTMLGDNPEKSRNPLKIAMRRRNAKTVAFSAPTYFEPSDIDYSTEEDGDEDGYANGTEIAEEEETDNQHGQEIAGTEVIEPLKVRRPAQGNGNIDDKQVDTKHESTIPSSIQATEASLDRSRTSDEIFEQQDDDSFGKSRKGTVRNTDSFFKDDNAETRKINLTPSLLRDDSSSSTILSSESKDPKARGSLDVLEKVASPPEKGKDDRKRKDKKSGMLSGLFKRRDRKSKLQGDDTEETDRLSEELRRSPQPKVSSDSLSRDNSNSKPTSPAHPQRQSSKLQKAPPTNLFPSKKPTQARDEPVTQRAILAGRPSTDSPQSDSQPSIASQINSPMSAVERGPESAVKDSPSPLRMMSPDSSEEPPRSPTSLRAGMFSPFRDALRHSPSSSEPKPERVKKAKQRVAMDDFDSSPETEEPKASFAKSEELHTSNGEPYPSDHSSGQDDRSIKERLSESPVQVSPHQETSPVTHPPGLMIDTSSQEDPSMSPVSSPSSTPELIDVPHPEQRAREETPVSTAQSVTSTAPAWSDADLRTYLDNENDIRDLLVVVHDKSDVKPVGMDHPIIGNMFRDENRRLGEMSNRLDWLLNDLLARKSKAAGR